MILQATVRGPDLSVASLQTEGGHDQAIPGVLHGIIGETGLIASNPLIHTFSTDHAGCSSRKETMVPATSLGFSMGNR